MSNTSPSSLSDPVDQPQASSARRLTALDSVRGVAAFAVLLHHCYLTFPDAPREHLDTFLWARPLRLFINGQASVIIFFLLSGYVLALPFFRGTQPSYLRYAFKRVCRIYIPFAIAISISVFLCASNPVRESFAGAGGWLNFQGYGGVTLTPSMIARHFFMTGTNNSLDPVMWSLVYEMRISLVFPLLMILCRDTRVALLAAAVMLVGSTKILVALGQSGPWGSNFWITFLWTVRMIPYFIIGILLSKHADNIHQCIQHVPEQMRIAIIAVPIIIFTIPHSYLYNRMDVLYDIGAATVIVMALEIPSVSAMLNRSVLQWLGRISYSLYLIHTPILYVTFYALLGRVPFLFIVLTVIAISLGMATLMYRFVEVPAIKLGQRIARVRPITSTPSLDNDQDDPKPALESLGGQTRI